MTFVRIMHNVQIEEKLLMWIVSQNQKKTGRKGGNDDMIG